VATYVTSLQARGPEKGPVHRGPQGHDQGQGQQQQQQQQEHQHQHQHQHQHRQTTGISQAPLPRSAKESLKRKYIIGHEGREDEEGQIRSREID